MRAHTMRGLLRMACAFAGLGLCLVGLRLPFLCLLLVGGVAWHRFRRAAGSTWSHGTARLSGYRELAHHSMLGDDGLILGTTGLMPRPTYMEGLSALWSGRVPAALACHLFLSTLRGPRCVADRMVRIPKYTHLATFAKTGGGKGVSILIPNLLSYPHSCVVTDPKGELFGKTARHRREKFGHKTIRLDPAAICGPGSDTFNPLDFIDDTEEDFLDQCRDLADMLVLRTGSEKDPYWDDSARSVICAFIAYVCACEDRQSGKRNLDTARDLLSGRSSFSESIGIMQQVESHGGVIQRLGHMMTWHEDKELASVLSNVQRHTETLDSPAIARNLAASSFDPRWLRTGRVTVYLCLKHDKLETLAPIMRVWIGMILRIITRGIPSERNPVMFFIDEAAHIGKINILENAVTIMRGMGIRLWFFFQSLHQLNECYGDKAKTILDNIDTQQHFCIKNPDNAEAISKQIGDETIPLVTHGENSGWSRPTGGGGTGQQPGNVSGGANTNYSDTGRRLLKPEELMTLPEDFSLVFHRNLPPIPVWLLKHFDHPAFANGGTGKQPGLGVAAAANAVALLLAAVLFAAYAALLCPPDAGRLGDGFSGLWPRDEFSLREGEWVEPLSNFPEPEGGWSP